VFFAAFPGIGQVYNSQYRKGAALVGAQIVFLAAPGLGAHFLVGVSARITAYVVTIADAIAIIIFAVVDAATAAIGKVTNRLDRSIIA
jgi:hypothetical protein